MNIAIGVALGARIRIRARQRTTALRQHPAIAGSHEITKASGRAGSELFSIATCQCRWRSQVEISEIAEQDAAIEGHWRDVIADSRGVAA